MNSNATHAPGLGQGALILHGLAKNWWMLLLRGISAIVFGVLALVWPGITIVSLVILYGAFALVDGVFSIIAAVTGSTPAPRWWLAVVGVIGILAGIVCFAAPAIAAVYFVLFMGAWALVSGIFEIVGAIRLRKEIDNEWMLIFHGALSVLFGLLLMAMPVVGALSLIWVIGIYAIIAGIVMSVLAFRLKKHAP